ncbi:MAG: glycerol-3-phosphate 1-O-acyltransferase PlsY [Proteobacteria bacterium]|jgi:glycerol-3-phosphate acyltransferase PlsY|nr:glycerol-3-phosphate 1-O-acyltransferase PlsY [Pseudomonadota bacterium]
MNPIDISLILFGYLLGSVNSAIIVCTLMRLPDPRSEGSGNPGTTNVLRVGGKRAALITLAGDLLKGSIPVVVAWLVKAPVNIVALTGVAAFLGHLFPLYYHFKGGKGVATMMGVLYAYSFFAGLATAATWIVIAKVFRISSLSALIATLLAPIYVWLIAGPVPELIVATAFMTAMLFWRHRSNIQRLLSGEEVLIGKKN